MNGHLNKNNDEDSSTTLRSKKKSNINLQICNNTFKYINENNENKIVLNYFTFIHYVVIIQTFYRRFHSKKLLKKLKKEYNENALKNLKQSKTGKLISNVKMKIKFLKNFVSQLSVVPQDSSDSSFSDENNNQDLLLNENKIEREIIENTIKGFYLYKKYKYKYEGYYNLTEKENGENSYDEVNKHRSKKVKHGFGIISFIDNSKVYSYFKENKANGITRYFNNEFNTYYYGDYKQGKPNGYAIFHNSHKTIYEGYFMKNYLNGICEIKYSDGSFYRGSSLNNQRNGIGFYRWYDGTIYVGEFYNNLMKGYCIIYYNNERMYQGQVENGLKNGYGEFTWGIGQKYIGYYKENLKHGFGIFVSNIKPFNAYIGYWKEGKMDGIGMKIINNKQKCGIYKDGKLVEKLLGSWAFKDYMYNPTIKENSPMNRTSSLLSISIGRKKSSKKLSFGFSPKRTISINKMRKLSSKNDTNKKLFAKLCDNEAFVNFMMQNVDYIKRFIIDKYIKDSLEETDLKRPISKLLM